MVSKEGSDSRRGGAWSAKEHATALRPIYERELQKLEAGRRRSEALSQLDLGSVYAELVLKEKLAEGVWHRGGGNHHDFLVVLADPSPEKLHNMRSAEVALQGIRLFDSLNFQVEFSDLTAEKKEDMIRSGYTFIPGAENDALQPPPK